MTLLNIVRALDPETSRRVSHIIIDPDRRVAILSVHWYQPLVRTSEGGLIGNGVAVGAPPPGVTAFGSERMPDITEPIDIDRVDEQIHDLHAAGLCGQLDAARIGPRWHIRTHAGSDAERLAWLQSVARDPSW